MPRRHTPDKLRSAGCLADAIDPSAVFGYCVETRFLAIFLCRRESMCKIRSLLLNGHLCIPRTDSRLRGNGGSRLCRGNGLDGGRIPEPEQSVLPICCQYPNPACAFCLKSRVSTQFGTIHYRLIHCRYQPASPGTRRPRRWNDGFRHQHYFSIGGHIKQTQLRPSENFFRRPVRFTATARRQIKIPVPESVRMLALLSVRA